MPEPASNTREGLNTKSTSTSDNRASLGMDLAAAKGIGTVFVFAAVAAAMGAGKEIAIAWRFGVSDIVDAYQFSFAMVQWPLSILAASYFATIVPQVIGLRERAQSQVSQFRAEVLGLTLLALGPLCLAVYFGLKFVVGQAFAGMEGQQLVFAQSGLLPMTGVFGFGLLAVICGGWMMAEGRHTNTLLQAIPAATLVVAIPLFVVTGAGLLWSTALGFLLYACSSVLALPGGLRQQRLNSPMGSNQLRLLLAAIGTLLFGQFLLSFVTLVDQWFAARLGPGALSLLGYATRVNALLLSVIAVAVARGVLPIFSRIQVEQPQVLRRTVFRYAGGVFVAGVGLAVAGFLLSDWLVNLLFRRGEFTAQDADQVSVLVRYAVVQIPFYLSSLVVVSALLAQSRHRAVTLAAAINGVVKLVLAYWLANQYGLPGLLLATAGVYLLSTLVCSVQLLRSPKNLRTELPW